MFLKNGEFSVDDSYFSHEVIEAARRCSSIFLQWFREWQSKTGAVILKQEHSMISPRLGFGGTLDLLVQIPGGNIFIIDIKTSNRVYNTVAAQVAAYKKLYISSYPEGADKEETVNAIIFNVDKEGFTECLWPSRRALKDGWDYFQGLFKAYKAEMKLTMGKFTKEV